MILNSLLCFCLLYSQISALLPSGATLQREKATSLHLHTPNQSLTVCPAHWMLNCHCMSIFACVKFEGHSFPFTLKVSVHFSSALMHFSCSTLPVQVNKSFSLSLCSTAFTFFNADVCPGSYRSCKGVVLWCDLHVWSVAGYLYSVSKATFTETSLFLFKMYLVCFSFVF